MKFMSLFYAGGATVIILALCSILSWTLIMERVFHYWSKSRVQRIKFMARIAAQLKEDDIHGALEESRQTNTPFASVVLAGLNHSGQDSKMISNAMEREITVQTRNLEQNTGIVGTIGSVAVYIGLFGTVLGIIRAFFDISTSSSGGINVVIRGISEALVCTAVGLAVAIPSVIAYNYFAKKIDSFAVDMELCASETSDLLSGTGQ